MQPINWDTFSRYLKYVGKVNPRSWHKSVLLRYNAYFSDKELTTMTLSEFFEWEENEFDITNATLNCHLKIIRHIGKHLGMPYESITAGFTRFKEDEPTIVPLTEEERENLIKACYSLGLKQGLICELLAKTGMRNDTELCNLKWSDLQGDTITVIHTKNKRPNTIPLLGDLPKRLLMFKEINTFPHGYMFGSRQGRMKYCTVNEYLREGARRAGITKYVHAHILRHTFGTIQTDHDVNTLKLKEFMNHKSVTSTERYVHLSMKAKYDVAKRDPLNRFYLKTEDVIDRTKKYYEEIKESNTRKELFEDNEKITLVIYKK